MIEPRTSVASSGLKAVLLGLGLTATLACRPNAAGGTPVIPAPPTPAFPGTHQRLSSEQSPYLRQHADNAVDWYPWGEEAFAKAKAEDKPVFLSVGYSTCHWCHVMEEESFLNPVVGAYLNEHFVPIKVDRETRPDIDRLYMKFLVDTTGGGGWPMSVFLTPEAQPFYAGTYFPQPAKYGRAAFLEVLETVSHQWVLNSATIKKDASNIAQQLQQVEPANSSSSDLPSPKLIQQAVKTWKGSFDAEHGGFNGAPKFPQAPILECLLVHARTDPKSGTEKMVFKTLESMAKGGIHDQLDGGFHRYSTDANWTVPHFEKMLTDQALLLTLYARAYAWTDQEIFRTAAESTASYLDRRTRLPSGGLASAEDADSADPGDPSQHSEGAFYVWTLKEVEEVLGGGEALTQAKAVFGVTQEGNASGDESGELAGKNVLLEADGKLWNQDPAKEARAKLLAARDRRPRPARDEKVLAGWNAMAASSLAEAGSLLSKPEWLGRSRAILELLETRMVAQGRLQRSYFEGKADGEAFAQDYAEIIAAYLALYAAEARPADLLRAVHWQSQLDERFADSKGGGYFETPADHGLLYRDKELSDGAIWSANSRAAVNLVTLYRLTGQENYRTTLEGLLRSVGPALKEHPENLPGILTALDLWNGEEESVVLVGVQEPWWDLISSGYHPQRVAHWLKSDLERQELAPMVSYLKELPNKSAAYVCQNFTCGLPITSLGGLRERFSPKVGSRK